MSFSTFTVTQHLRSLLTCCCSGSTSARLLSVAVDRGVISADVDVVCMFLCNCAGDLVSVDIVLLLDVGISSSATRLTAGLLVDDGNLSVESLPTPDGPGLMVGGSGNGGSAAGAATGASFRCFFGAGFLGSGFLDASSSSNKKEATCYKILISKKEYQSM